MNKDEKYQNLERVNSWINNVDTKISYMLAFIGIIATIIFTNDNIIKTIKVYIDNILNFTIKDIKNLISLLLLVLTGVMIIYISKSIYYLLKASVATIKGGIKSQDDSILFFGSIAKNQNFEEFKKKIKNSDEKKIEEDIIMQIYNNSIICNKKFENYNKAILDIKKALVIFLIIIITMFFSI